MPENTFRSVKTHTIAEAFAKAHTYASRAFYKEDRKLFLEIARLIWNACGEQSPMPSTLPPNLAALGTSNASDRSHTDPPEVKQKP